MANLKQFFENADNGVLSYAELEAAMKESGSKFVDLTEGNYVAKNKYENEIQTLTSQIEELNGAISTRDTDLSDLRTKLEAAGADSEKIGALTKDFESLQAKYNEDTKAYEDKLKKQSYEFAVREFAGAQQFSSKAAKKEFIRSMVDEGLKMKDGQIIGADDFLTNYQKDNLDSFITEYDGDDDFDYGNDGNDYVPEHQPQFVAPTPGGEPIHDATQAFTDAFHFTGVRPMSD